MNELVSESFRELLEFYSEHHPDARFGALDLPTLQRALQTLEVAAERVHSAEAAVVQAREEFGTAEANVSSIAQRAVSFLNIHVEADAAQIARLEVIANGLGAHRRKPRTGLEVQPAASPETRQRRSRKGKSTSASQSDLPLRAEMAEGQVSSADLEVDESSEAEDDSVSDDLRSASFAAE